MSSSADTGTHKSKNKVEWKSTADSAPNPASAALSKESIVPQRSQAVDNQPTSNADGSPDIKGKVWGLQAPATAVMLQHPVCMKHVLGFLMPCFLPFSGLHRLPTACKPW